MCGHLTIFSRRKFPPEHALRYGLAQLRHRGPDAERVWSSADRRVAMGHTRLRIIDLSTGDQPLATEDGAIHAVVNGEFYDYARIRAELASRGHRFATASDSEILLYLWRERGPACLSELRGEFAFTLWDERAGTLFAARDRFGIKPLYYSWFEERLYIASEIKALFAAGIPARWDESSVHYYHYLQFHPPGRTLYENVRELPPGHCLWASDRDFRVSRYWDLSYPVCGAEPAPPSDAESAEQVRTALSEAVRLRLQADVPVGCYLSGGIDSAAVLGLATLHGRPPPVFTVVFDDPQYDEGTVAREMADHARAEFHPVSCSASDLARSFHAALRHAETPLYNLHGVAKYLLSRAVRDAGFKVVLTGEGADEMFGGYHHFLDDHILSCITNRNNLAANDPDRNLELGEQSRQRLMSVLAQEARHAGVTETLGYLPFFLVDNLWHSRILRSLLRPGTGAGHPQPLAALLADIDVSGQLAGREVMHQSLYLWSKTVLPGYILSVMGDRMEMAHGVEGRLPFLDHRLVETVVRLPVATRPRGMVEKFVLRAAVRDVVTDTIFRRKKWAFQTRPLSAHTAGPLHDFMQDTLRGSALLAFPFYDRTRVVALLENLAHMDPRRRASLDRVMTMALSFVVLQQELISPHASRAVSPAVAAPPS